MSQGGQVQAPGGGKGGQGPTMGQAQPYGGNVFQQAQQGLSGSMQGSAAGMNFNPMMIGAGGGGGGAPTVNGQYSGEGYKGAQVAGVDPYTSRQVGGMDLSGYTNPWENQVVQGTLGDLDRQRQMQAMQQGAIATSQGAFGGSRQALMDTENNRNYMQQMARTSGDLRSQGFLNAQNAAFQDIGNQNQASQFNAGTNMQAQLANQASGNQANQYSAAARNEANQFNAGAKNQFGLQQMQNQQAAASNALQAQLANQQAWQNAANFRLNASGQLGNQANLGFGMGQQAQTMASNQGGVQRGIQQNIIDAAKGQYGNYTQNPYADMTMLTSTISGQPVPQGQTSGYTPGLMDYAGTAIAGYGAFKQ